MYKILMFTVWVEIVHLYVLTVANSLLSGDLMLWGHPNAITGRQVRGFSECHNLCLLIPVLVYRSTVTYCTVSSSSCRCVPQSREEQASLAGIHRCSFCPLYPMANCLMQE